MEQLEATNGDIQAAIEAGKKIAGLKAVSIEGVPHLLIPNDCQLKVSESLMDSPKRTKQSVSMIDADSFSDYFNKFADDNSAIFCDPGAGKFLAVIDYHSETKPAWCEHRVVYSPNKTHEANAWLQKSGIKMSQTDFAIFIEDNAEEITIPPAAEMLEIALTLKAKNKITFTSGRRLDNGQTQIQYMEEIEGRGGAKGQLNIPETFSLGMRVYDGGDAYEMKARFRYRIRDGELTMWYDLVRPHKVTRAAIDDIYQKIKADTKCQLLINGSPQT